MVSKVACSNPVVLIFLYFKKYDKNKKNYKFENFVVMNNQISKNIISRAK